MECLMIKRARLTVYNAQEADTFGKDSEAGVTLTQTKPVVVFVARLFDQEAAFQPLYKAIYSAAPIQRDEFLELLRTALLLSVDDSRALLGPEKTKADVIDAVINKHSPKIVSGLGEDQVGMELIRQGYQPGTAGQDVFSFAVERILKLERRAL